MNEGWNILTEFELSRKIYSSSLNFKRFDTVHFIFEFKKNYLIIDNVDIITLCANLLNYNNNQVMSKFIPMFL